MKPKDFDLIDYLDTCRRLAVKGWEIVGMVGEMKFRKRGKTYDLSAADLTQLDLIEEKGLFLVG